MKKFFIVYNRETAYWCFEGEALDLTNNHGWTLYGATDNEVTANELVEKVCFI